MPSSNILLITKDGETLNITKKNKKVIGLANKVKNQSEIYKKQLVKCKNSLNKNKYIIF